MSGLCDCPIDWVVCFSADCPRGARIRQQQAAAHARARAFLGDPTRGVGRPLAPSPSNTEDAR